jgi:hypothetical protein
MTTGENTHQELADFRAAAPGGLRLEGSGPVQQQQLQETLHGLPALESGIGQVQGSPRVDVRL